MSIRVEGRANPLTAFNTAPAHQAKRLDIVPGTEKLPDTIYSLIEAYGLDWQVTGDVEAVLRNAFPWTDFEQRLGEFLRQTFPNVPERLRAQSRLYSELQYRGIQGQNRENNQIKRAVDKVENVRKRTIRADADVKQVREQAGSKERQEAILSDVKIKCRTITKNYRKMLKERSYISKHRFMLSMKSLLVDRFINAPHPAALDSSMLGQLRKMLMETLKFFQDPEFANNFTEDDKESFFRAAIASGILVECQWLDYASRLEHLPALKVANDPTFKRGHDRYLTHLCRLALNSSKDQPTLSIIENHILKICEQKGTNAFDLLLSAYTNVPFPTRLIPRLQRFFKVQILHSTTFTARQMDSFPSNVWDALMYDSRREPIAEFYSSVVECMAVTHWHTDALNWLRGEIDQMLTQLIKAEKEGNFLCKARLIRGLSKVKTAPEFEGKFRRSGYSLDSFFLYECYHERKSALVRKELTWFEDYVKKSNVSKEMRKRTELLELLWMKFVQVAPQMNQEYVNRLTTCLENVHPAGWDFDHQRMCNFKIHIIEHAREAHLSVDKLNAQFEAMLGKMQYSRTQKALDLAEADLKSLDEPLDNVMSLVVAQVLSRVHTPAICDIFRKRIPIDDIVRSQESVESFVEKILELSAGELPQDVPEELQWQNFKNNLGEINQAIGRLKLHARITKKDYKKIFHMLKEQFDRKQTVAWIASLPNGFGYHRVQGFTPPRYQGNRMLGVASQAFSMPPTESRRVMPLTSSRNQANNPFTPKPHVWVMQPVYKGGLTNTSQVRQALPPSKMPQSLAEQWDACKAEMDQLFQKGTVEDRRKALEYASKYFDARMSEMNGKSAGEEDRVILASTLPKDHPAYAIAYWRKQTGLKLQIEANRAIEPELQSEVQKACARLISLPSNAVVMQEVLLLLEGLMIKNPKMFDDAAAQLLTIFEKPDILQLQPTRALTAQMNKLLGFAQNKEVIEKIYHILTAPAGAPPVLHVAVEWFILHRIIIFENFSFEDVNANSTLLFIYSQLNCFLLFKYAKAEMLFVELLSNAMEQLDLAKVPVDVCMDLNEIISKSGALNDLSGSNPRLVTIWFKLHLKIIQERPENCFDYIPSLFRNLILDNEEVMQLWVEILLLSINFYIDKSNFKVEKVEIIVFLLRFLGKHRSVYSPNSLKKIKASLLLQFIKIGKIQIVIDELLERAKLKGTSAQSKDRMHAIHRFYSENFIGHNPRSMPAHLQTLADMHEKLIVHTDVHATKQFLVESENAIKSIGLKLIDPSYIQEQTVVRFRVSLALCDLCVRIFPCEKELNKLADWQTICYGKGIKKVMGVKGKIPENHALDCGSENIPNDWLQSLNTSEAECRQRVVAHMDFYRPAESKSERKEQEAVGLAKSTKKKRQRKKK